MAGPAADEQDPRPLRLAARRAAERPSLVAIRFFGLLVAVTLVVGVSLYSTGMGDAMLRARLAGDPSSPNLALSLTNEPLTGARYAALDSYFRRRASLDLGLPLRGLIVQHSTSTVPLYRLRPGRASLATTALAQVALAYDEDLAAHATIIEGTLDGPAAGRGGAVPVLLSRDAARGLQLRIGDRLAYSADGKR